MCGLFPGWGEVLLKVGNYGMIMKKSKLPVVLWYECVHGSLILSCG